MKAARATETSVNLYRTPQRPVPEDNQVHSNHLEDVKPYTTLVNALPFHNTSFTTDVVCVRSASCLVMSHVSPRPTVMTEDKMFFPILVYNCSFS